MTDTESTGTRRQSDVPAGPAHSSEVNERMWVRRGPARYDNRILRPDEVVILARYSEKLSGRVLEIGCGGGRILGYLLALSDDVHAIDVSQAMIAHCRAVYPRADVRLGSLRDLEASIEGTFDAVVAADNVLDVVDADDRRLALTKLRQLMRPGGVLLFSSHNLSSREVVEIPARGARSRRILSQLARTTPAEGISWLPRLRRRWWNRRRLRPLEVRGPDYAILNDSEGDFGALHYYSDRDTQQRQLEMLGWELLECIDADANRVEPGQTGASSSLMYAARPAHS